MASKSWIGDIDVHVKGALIIFSDQAGLVIYKSDRSIKQRKVNAGMTRKAASRTGSVISEAVSMLGYLRERIKVPKKPKREGKEPRF
jgi:hypothetical protein